MKRGVALLLAVVLLLGMIPVASAVLREVSVHVGETISGAEYVPSSLIGHSGGLSWYSDNNCVSIDRMGNITGCYQGSAQVTAMTAMNGGIVFSVNVLPRKIQKIILQENASVSVGSTVRLQVSTVPDGRAGRLSWPSSDPSVATVNSFGTVTGCSAGTCKIQTQLDGVFAGQDDAPDLEAYGRKVEKYWDLEDYSNTWYVGNLKLTEVQFSNGYTWYNW